MEKDDNNNNNQSGKKRPLSATTSETTTKQQKQQSQVLYLEEGLFAVNKPLGWTSQDVVGKLRHILEDDAKIRGAPDPRTKKRRPWMKVGHGGTLDPLATGVLVCGVGSGTKNLQKYLVGSKSYRAEITLGYQTSTLDADVKGEIVEEKSYDHVTSYELIEKVLPDFTGNIQQIPPVFSALKRDGKRLYELGRKGQTAEDLKIEPREVTIYDLKLIQKEDDKESKKPIQTFCIEVECGGGTYIRSLVRDIGIALGTVATMTQLERTKQGQFFLDHCLPYSSTVLGTVATMTQLERTKQGQFFLDHCLPYSSTVEEVKHDEEGRIIFDKRKDCDWTVSTINEAIRDCRENILQNNNDDDGLRSSNKE
eukprot:CAMPEP_0194161062 /NCGR_PEP_ID=MMETSP0152-20130528/78735_1 /TAXON_ID=1049557 /ORGANISM="Thalassiothrix antarctica, Strain L6-D1" /LENGTH=365 /DNA_ID=CAMNT_0038870811 /DNA_START=204 /DNA_END=1301 /DNA_ORIENTATION=-